MPLAIQQTPKGPVFILECEGCGKAIRVLTGSVKNVREAATQWKGEVGLYMGKWVFICAMCKDEAATGEHVNIWRW
jgi:hypothetical protein